MPAAQQVRDLVDNMMRTALLDVDHKVSLLATHVLQCVLQCVAV